MSLCSANIQITPPAFDKLSDVTTVTIVMALVVGD